MMVELGLIGTLSLLAVVVIGLPHGAMDAAVALALGYRGPARLMLFLIIYTLVAAAVVLFWIAAPTVALALFLLISLVHFGLGDSDRPNRLERGVQMLAHGGVVVVAIPFFHADSTAVIFGLLGASPETLRPMLDALAWLGLPVALAYAVLAWRRPGLRAGLAEWALLLGLVAVLPPLAGFAFYFTLVHTPRHIRRILASLDRASPPLPVMKTTIGLTLATWAMAAAAGLILAAGSSLSEASLKVVFIGLAALTVPHMILIDGMFRPTMERLKANAENR